MINLCDLENDEKCTSADIGYKENLEFTFKLSFYTPAVGESFRNAADPMKQQIATMADAITSWDIVETRKDADGRTILGADGKPQLFPVPVSIEAINRMSIPQINAIYTAMEELAFPPKTKDAS